MPICGIPNDTRTTETNDVLTEEENVNSMTEKKLMTKCIADIETSSFLPQSENSELEHDAIQDHIGKLMIEPINEYSTQLWWPRVAIRKYVEIFE